jgi:hypothetical protein
MAGGGQRRGEVACWGGAGLKERMVICLATAFKVFGNRYRISAERASPRDECRTSKMIHLSSLRSSQQQDRRHRTLGPHKLSRSMTASRSQGPESKSGACPCIIQQHMGLKLRPGGQASCHPFPAPQPRPRPRPRRARRILASERCFAPPRSSPWRTLAFLTNKKFALSGPALAGIQCSKKHYQPNAGWKGAIKPKTESRTTRRFVYSPIVVRIKSIIHAFPRGIARHVPPTAARTWMRAPAAVDQCPREEESSGRQTAELKKYKRRAARLLFYQFKTSESFGFQRRSGETGHGALGPRPAEPAGPTRPCSDKTSHASTYFFGILIGRRA